MIELEQIKFYKKNLEVTNNFRNTTPPVPMTRIYNDSLQGLAFLGLFPENNKYVFDDGTEYEITEYASRMINKMKEASHKEMPIKAELKDTEKGAIEKPVIKEVESNNNCGRVTCPPVSEEPEQITVQQPQETSGSINMILSKNSVQVINKKNPSDVKEYTVLVSPLNVRQNVASTDIAICFIQNGAKQYLVSGKGVKSIQLEIDGFNFMVRGQWKSNRFLTSLYLQGAPDYELKVKETLIFPEELCPDYNSPIVLGEDNIYILPLNKLNEPNGLCDCFIIQETEEDRQIHVGENGILFLHIGEKNYRIFGKWDEHKQFVRSVEEV